ncbi:DNA recombination protein RmuC [Desulfuromusa kysingii]|uniref:DNA recombination protein RmuC n=1 Tax=Desulfuromusa kysingii TaxID=37625 RepID=A0A1H4C828_9BACT|nr:DNA recombination protein RmuC [Desulfuromusa kysingii]SEA56463.1 DNA recombination protein RmuC [Desulfuromusa kysingii]
MPLTDNIWILPAATLIVGLFCGWLIARLQAHLLLHRERHKDQVERDQLLQQVARVEAQLEAERHANADKLRFLDETRQQVEKNFQALSAQALAANNQSFLDLAKTTLGSFQQQAKGDLDARHQAIGQLVQPLQESLTKVDHKIEQLEQSRSGAYARLDEQLKSLLNSQIKLESETGNLVRALRTPAVRGRWGEIQLRKVVEMAGMVNYCDFVEQETADHGRLRPDMIIKLPNGRNIIVDSKAPLQAYLESLEATDDKQRNACLAHHARQIHDHLQKLSAKNYWEQFQPTPEFVVLFLPGETFFSAALTQDPGLIEAGVDQKVLLATPTTLIALLRSVAYGWRQEQLTENAEAISQLGREMYDRLATLNQHFAQMGKNLERAVDSYNKAIGSLDSRVLTSARKFKELGAGSRKEINPIEQIDKRPRSLQPPEA